MHSISSKFKLNCVALLVISMCAFGYVRAEETITSTVAASGGGMIKTRYNSSFLSSGIDASRFEKGAGPIAGTYRSDIYLNQHWVGRRDIEIRNVQGSNQTITCLDQTFLNQLGVILPTHTNSSADVLALDVCVDIAKSISAASATFDVSELRVDISVPQLYLRRMARGYIDESEWDQGINAGFLGYNLDASTNKYGDNQTSQLYGQLNLGLNIFGWRLRQNNSYSIIKSDQESTSISSNRLVSYAQRDITSLKSQLTVGEAYSSNSNLFDSVGFTGVQLSSDDRMLPYSQRGYAPVIRGIAETNAKIQIRQGNNLIYESTVAPGEFRIDDLNDSGYGGDFSVTVIEADGRRKQFIVPYSSGVQLLREGNSKYSALVGQLRDSTLINRPYFGQATYQLGLAHGTTFYTGLIASKNYYAGLAGVAVSTSFGGISADLTQSYVDGITNVGSLQGQSWRLSYSSLIETSKTNLTLAAYRYSTENYMSFSDAAKFKDDMENQGYSNFGRAQSRLQLNISQPINDNSSLFLSGSSQTYWNNSSSDTSFNAGISKSFSWGGMNLSVGRTSNFSGGYSNQMYASLNFPIGASNKVARPLVSTSVTYNDKDNSNAMLSMSGSTGPQNAINYSVNGGYQQTSGVGTNNIGTSMQYATPIAHLSGSLSRGTDYKQASVSASGTIVGHAGGVNMLPDLGDTFGIVEANGLEGAAINGSKSILNRSGYGVISNLTPYSRNEVSLDPKGTSINVELDSSSQYVTPRAGAIVKLNYVTTVGNPILMQLKRFNGMTIPAGASVTDPEDRVVGMVAQGGRVFTRLVNSRKTLTVKWGSELDQRCFVDAVFPEVSSDQLIQKVSLMCQADVNLDVDANKSNLIQKNLPATTDEVGAELSSASRDNKNTLYPLLLNLLHANSGAIPVGAEVMDESGNILGLTRSGNKFFARLMPANGKLTVKWGSAADNQCVLNYSVLEAMNSEQEIKKTTVRCE